MLTPKDIVESEQYQLDRKATAMKKAGDWSGAIAALRKRKALLGVSYQDDKLAKYLQAAGRFDDAIAEIQWLIDHSHAWAQSMFSHQAASVLESQRMMRRAQIYDAAALICKREKRHELEAEYVHQGDACRSRRRELELVAKGDTAFRKLDWQTAQTHGPGAMREFLNTRQKSTARNMATRVSAVELDPTRPHFFSRLVAFFKNRTKT